MTQVETVPKPRRNVELALLLLALTIGIGAKFLVAITMDEPFDRTYYTDAALLAGVSLAFHIVLRLRVRFADPFILPIVVALNGLGMAMIHRLDLVDGGPPAEDRQLMWTLVSMVAAMAVLCLAYLVLGVRSFVAARRQGEVAS